MAADSPHHIIGLIPSRWGSSRFPGKPLHLDVYKRQTIDRIIDVFPSDQQSQVRTMLAVSYTHLSGINGVILFVDGGIDALLRSERF